jgi:methyl-accepting chemotaxis protein
MLSRTKISGKLFLGFGLILAILALASAYNIMAGSAVRDKARYVKDVRFQNAVDLILISNLAENSLNGYGSAADAANIVPLEEANRARQELEKEISRVRHDGNLDPNLLVLLDRFEGLFRTAALIGVEMAQVSIDQDFMAYVSLKREFNAAIEPFSTVSADLRQSASQALFGTLEEIEELSRKNLRSSVVLAFVGVLIGALLAVMISRNITAAMAALVRMIEEFGRGNLYARADLQRTDEIGQVATAVNVMAERLQGMVTRISGSTVEVQQISASIDQAAHRVEGSAQSQANGVETVSTAVETIDSSVEKVWEGVDQVSRSASESTASVLEVSSSIEEVAGSAETLAQLVGEVSSSIAQMISATRQVAESSQLLKESSEVTASSVVQMDSSIKSVEERTRDMSEIAGAVRHDAVAGKTSVEATVNGMAQIRQAAELSSAVIESLSVKAGNIGSILSVINEVTDQTSLLALNAAIIAAQAGEHGRGFSVVAEEINELAKRTSSSTREIGKVLHGFQEETVRAVEAIRQAQQSVMAGEELSRQSGTMLDRIVQGADNAASAMQQIAQTTAEQSQGSKMIRSFIDTMASRIDHIAGAILEQSKGGEMIMKAAEQMKDMTQQVKSSTREQSEASRVIARSIEEISDRLQSIRKACEEQKEQSIEIVQAVDAISQTAGAHLEATRLLKSAASGLSGQVNMLEKEMQVFQLVEDHQQ